MMISWGLILKEPGQCSQNKGFFETAWWKTVILNFDENSSIWKDLKLQIYKHKLAQKKNRKQGLIWYQVLFPFLVFNFIWPLEIQWASCHKGSRKNLFSIYILLYDWNIQMSGFLSQREFAYMVLCDMLKSSSQGFLY